MEMENKYASRGVAGAGLGLGIAGTALGLGVLNGGLGGILGGAKTNTAPDSAIWNAALIGAMSKNCTCNEEHTVNRYEAAQSARIAELETEVKLRDANIYTDGKIADVYERLNTKIGVIEAQINAQAVYNATLNGTVGCIQGQIAQLMALTKTVIPAANICPAPMPQYNSWTAPTATTAG